MENLRIRCKICNKEIEGNTSKSISCGCNNVATIHNNNKITAFDLSQVLMLNSYQSKTKSGILTNEDIAWQESRRQRKVRKLDFEIR